MILRKGVDGIGHQPCNWAPLILQSFTDRLDQWTHIPITLPQRWQLNGEDIQTIKEILTEFSLLNILLQITVSRCHYPHIGTNALDATNTLKGALLQHPQ